MSIAEDLVAFLSDVEGLAPVHYQHAKQSTEKRFIWFLVAGSDLQGGTLDRGEPPDTIYFDLEIYASDLDDYAAQIEALSSLQDYEGDFGSGSIQDLRIEDQRDDYEPLASGESVPPFNANFRLTIIGYDNG